MPDVSDRALEYLLRLSASLAATLPLVFAYRLTHRRVGYDPEMARNLVLLSAAVCAIMMGISHNLALSLGLVGALSIVRFRTAIKYSGDLLYFLVAISAGLIASTGDLVLLLCAVGFYLVVIALLALTRFGSPSTDRFTLIFTCPSEAAVCARILERFAAAFPRVRLSSQVPAPGDEARCELTLLVNTAQPGLFTALDRVRQQEDLRDLQVYSAGELVQV